MIPAWCGREGWWVGMQQKTKEQGHTLSEAALPYSVARAAWIERTAGPLSWCPGSREGPKKAHYLLKILLEYVVKNTYVTHVKCTGLYVWSYYVLRSLEGDAVVYAPAPPHYFQARRRKTAVFSLSFPFLVRKKDLEILWKEGKPCEREHSTVITVIGVHFDHLLSLELVNIAETILFLWTFEAPVSLMLLAVLATSWFHLDSGE